MASGKPPRDFVSEFILGMAAKPTVDVLWVGCGLQMYRFWI